MTQRLRIGVIGVGRQWEARHKPALTKLREQFMVTAVCDQALRRAELEAKNLRCAAVASVTELVERVDVDAVYLLAPQWHGLFAIAAACKVGKPAYCGSPFVGDLGQLERVASLAKQAGTIVMPEFARRYYPATNRLRELIADVLGKPKEIAGRVALASVDRTAQISALPLPVDPASNLIDWCRYVIGEELTNVSAENRHVYGVKFAGGMTANFEVIEPQRDSVGAATTQPPDYSVHVIAENGNASISFPDRIKWAIDGVEHEEQIASERSVGELLNLAFHQAVTRNAMAPTLEDALSVARWMKQ